MSSNKKKFHVTCLLIASQMTSQMTLQMTLQITSQMKSQTKSLVYCTQSYFSVYVVDKN